MSITGDLVIDIEKEFGKYFSKLLHIPIHITLPQERIDRIDSFAQALAEDKMKELHYQIDGDNLYEREYGGLAGESAVEIFLGVEFMDWTIGPSRQYHVSDLKKIGYDVGIKCSFLGSFPMVSIRANRPEIIVIRASDTKLLICGLAETHILNRYQDVNYVRSKKLKARNAKAGFYGFEHLIEIEGLDDLKKYKL